MSEIFHPLRPLKPSVVIVKTSKNWNKAKINYR